MYVAISYLKEIQNGLLTRGIQCDNRSILYLCHEYPCIISAAFTFTKIRYVSIGTYMRMISIFQNYLIRGLGS